MFKFLRVKRRFGIDLVFIVILGILYWSFHSGLPTIQPQVNDLFLATFLFLGFGTLSLYLAADINPKLASLTHTGFFPLASLTFLALKWLPSITSGFEESKLLLSLGIIGYGIVLIAYFNIQFLIHRKEPNPQELRKIRNSTK
ncbi:hypothetical protein AKJ53_01190 [candidate division MSBL1 archaeon SCGC-AAA382F02]|uniref:Uncharacterized protein n=1 Tax=candidate division MSBL1 archaeon SCGC-AAA382F02 TaxID=1698282 RepID=A0A133VI59_9EURY|nr:hypothetical protein AKJ53_01190 [candidate division MSBL1 archaeon SCGC-AAA382F02]